jgi:uncharacterized protein (TIGR00255 family)
MIKSMTGFGQAYYEDDFLSCKVEVKSVNHRFLDLHARLPNDLSSLELRIRRIVQSKARRGRIDLCLNIERNDTLSFNVNTCLLRSYLTILEQLKRDFGFLGEVDVVQLLRIPGIVNLNSLQLSGQALKQLEDGIGEAVSRALDHLDQMKSEEGRSLRIDLLKRLDFMERELNKIKERAQGRTLAYQQHLQTRLTEMFKEIAIDPSRLLQEALLYAERSDISEEITRLQSHIDQCKTLLDSVEDTGKTLDFILQEMNREANTILSKTTGGAGSGLEITSSGVSIKAEIEKVREQIQNVE